MLFFKFYSSIGMMDFDIFLSYELSDKDIVQSFSQKLKEDFNFKVWIVDEQFSAEPLAQQLVNGIKKSKVFVSFLSKKYSESMISIREVSYALTLKKPCIILMIEKVDIVELGQLGFLASPLPRFNVYNDLEKFENGIGKEFELVMDSIIVTIINQAENSGKN